MAVWTYADWIQYDGEERLTRLREHITEVSQHVMGTTSRSKTVTAADSNYLDGLREEETKLVNRRDKRNFARNNVKFGRGEY